MAEEGQEHPISTYLWVWLLLFVLSAFSYAVDYIGFQGFTRWSLVLLFMFLKAYFICAVFMHMVWERMALVLTILGPPVVLLLLIGLMAVEGAYIEETRFNYRGHDRNAVALGPDDLHHDETHHGEENAH